MTDEASELAKELFTKYREQSALLSLDYKDETDLMVEKLMRHEAMDDLESNGLSLTSSQKVGPGDTLITEAV